MVVFTCNHCGENLQKPKVAKHYQFRCHRAPDLTCTDCLKDFRGEEYVAHTKCITEAERYGGKGYVPKPGANKGEKKQQEWIDVVHNVLKNTKDLSVQERSMLNSLSKYTNIPRKKAKFLNFIQNAMGRKLNMAVVESVWSKMETAYKQAVENNSENKQNNANKVTQNGQQENSASEKHQETDVAENQNNENICKENEEQQNKSNEVCEENTDDQQGETVKKRKKSKKRGLTDASEGQEEQPVSKKKSKNTSILSESNQCESTVENVVDNADEKAPFDWKSTIIDIVSAKEEISMKKLRKKVLATYMNHCSNEISYEKASSKFDKKLKKIPEIVVSEDKVRLNTV